MPDLELIPNEIELSVDEYRYVEEKIPEYTGVTNVIPATFEQTLATADLHVMNDITVEPIPYAEVSNLHGGYTAIIGG